MEQVKKEEDKEDQAEFGTIAMSFPIIASLINFTPELFALTVNQLSGSVLHLL